MGIAHLDLKVAHKGGEPCPICGSTIGRVPVQNRGTYFCPGCQPLSSGSLIEKLAAAGFEPATKGFVAHCFT